MRGTYNGKILHVDLNEERTWTEELEEGIYRKYLGGGALASFFLLRDLKPGIDPLSPENLLIIMTSVITGLPISGASRYTVAGKSPLTKGFGESEAGGYWGPELKVSGFDGIIVHGRADRPVYLYVHDGECEIRDAGLYWGKVSGEVQSGLEEEIGDKRIRVLQTGIAGENMVKIAAITNQMRHFNGRCGLGAVMGSKNLKAIVTRGHEKPQFSDRDLAMSVIKQFRELYRREEDGLHQIGTSRGVMVQNRDGVLPTYNFRDGAFDRAEEISGETMAEKILVNRGTCYACAVGCKREVEVPERGVIPAYGGMEYETLGSLGSLCGVGDLEAVAEASQWANAYVLDSISLGVTIAFAMECYEKGIITKEDTGGIELVWGDGDAMIQMIHKIAHRDGIGDLLAEGVKEAAARLGNGAEAYAMHVKGQELPMHEPRGKYGLSLGYATSPTGADHLEAPHDPVFETLDVINHDLNKLGLIDALDRFDFGPEKVRAFYYTQMVWSLYNSVGLCNFVAEPINKISLDMLRDYLKAATGWNVSIFELLKVGERANNMARMFNTRAGFSVIDDDLPDRLFEGLGKGVLAGTAIDREAFQQALKLYYKMAGWDENGVPTEAKLVELGLNGFS